MSVGSGWEGIGQKATHVSLGMATHFVPTEFRMRFIRGIESPNISSLVILATTPDVSTRIIFSSEQTQTTKLTPLEKDAFVLPASTVNNTPRRD